MRETASGTGGMMRGGGVGRHQDRDLPPRGRGLWKDEAEVLASVQRPSSSARSREPVVPRPEFVDQEVLVNSLLEERPNESEGTRNHKLQVHKWLVSLATFRDELARIEDTIRKQKGRVVEQKVKEQTNQNQFLDFVLDEGMRHFAGKTKEVQKLGDFVQSFMTKAAGVIHGTGEWSVGELRETFGELCEVREQLNSVYLPRRGETMVSKQDFYHFLQQVQSEPGTPAALRGQSPLLHKMAAGSDERDGDALGARVMGKKLARELAKMYRWLELRHAKEVKELRKEVSIHLGMEIPGAEEEEVDGRGANDSGVHDLMQRLAEVPFSDRGEDDIATFFHESYRSVMVAVQRAHARERGVLKGTVKRLRERGAGLAEELEAKTSALRERDRTIARLAEEREVSGLEREREKLQMIDALKKLDVIRVAEREDAERKERQREEERELEAAREKKRAEARALEREREASRQREREIEAMREKKWVEERKLERERVRKLEKEREKERAQREKERLQARDREAKARAEREEEKESQRKKDALRNEERHAEILARKEREMEREMDRRRIEILERELEKHRVDLEAEKRKIDGLREEAEREVEKRFERDLQVARERLENEKEKFFLMNPDREKLEARIKELEVKQKDLEAELKFAEEEIESAKAEQADLQLERDRAETEREYNLFLQKCQYEEKLQELQEKLRQLGNTFGQLPPTMVFPDAQPQHQRQNRSRAYPAPAAPMASPDPAEAEMFSSLGPGEVVDDRDTAYMRLLGDLKGLKSTIAAHGEGAAGEVVSASSTPGAGSPAELVGARARAAEEDPAAGPERDRLKDIASTLSSLPLGSAEPEGRPTQLSSKVVDLVKAINDISPLVWQETARQASVSSTDVLDQLLAKEQRASGAAAQVEATRNAKVIRRALEIAKA